MRPIKMVPRLHSKIGRRKARDKNTQNEIDNRLDIFKERISKHKDTAMKSNGNDRKEIL